jgi:hypothetical protein
VNVGEQSLSLKAAGLWLTANPLDAPPGALSEATNAVIRRPGVVEPRRGQKPDATVPSSARADAMATFEGALILHTSANVLARRVNDTTVTAYSGTFTPPTGYPMRFAEAGGALYATASVGPVRLDSPTSIPIAAGVPPGLEGSGTTTGATGWLATGSTVGYRLVWGTRDDDGAVLIGSPSGRILVSNATGGARDISLTSPIPAEVVAGTYFLQVYRTVITATSPADPGEDMAQVAEVFPTVAQVTARVMTFTDISSFANGATAYFSPSTGAGLADSKEQPPVVTDVLAFKGYSFGVVNAYRQVIEMSLLGVNGTASLALGDGIEFRSSTGAWSEGLIASGAPEGTQLVGPPPIAAWAFTMATGGTAAQNIEATARSAVRVLNLKATHMRAVYASGPSDLPGKIVFIERALSTVPVYVRAIVNGGTWVPSLRVYQDVSLTRAANVVTGTTAGAHHVVTGQTVTITSTDANFASGTKTVASTPTATTFTYAEAGANATALGQTFNTTTDDVELQQEAVPGSWATSAFQEPDAWPPRFHYQVGGPNTRLDRITAQGEALLFWTSEGLYRLTGDDEDSFTLRPMDPTVQLVGGQTPVTMGNKVFALTTQGVVSVSELGVEKISGPLDVPLLPYYASTDALKALTEAAAFGVGYQAENEYILFLPALDAEEGDPASLAYVYNTQTRTWVGPWEFNWAGINTGGQVYTGVVGPDNRLYLAAGSRLTRERKDREITDQQDTDAVGIPYDVAYQVQTASNPGAYKQWVEVTELLEKPQPASVELYFTTEISASEEGGTLTAKGNAAVRTYIPRNKSRSARLTVGLRHSTALETAKLLGLSVVYNVSSTRVGR